MEERHLLGLLGTSFISRSEGHLVRCRWRLLISYFVYNGPGHVKIADFGLSQKEKPARQLLHRRQTCSIGA